jgi:hypothetical protein
LILLKKSDLSTEKKAFTITTIFIYRSIVNRQKKAQVRGYFPKACKKRQKKTPTAHPDPLPNRLQDSLERSRQQKKCNAGLLMFRRSCSPGH